MSSTLKRTYSTRASTKPALPSSPPSELTSPPSSSLKRKRPFTDRPPEANTPTKKPRRTLISGKAKSGATDKAKSKQPKLTQLHFSLDTPTLRTCPLCDLSYTRGAPDDEALHKAHCARVQRGLEWGREEEREAARAGVEELESNIKLSNGSRGRIICFRPDVGGKIGAKLAILLETIRLALSSPPLSPAVLQRCKIYLFLMSKPGVGIVREKIVGCVVAQRISKAMAIAQPAEVSAQTRPDSAALSSEDASSSPADALQSTAATTTLLPVDSSTNLYVHPTPLPTPLGIPRLFVSSAHRRLGIASRLLSAAAATFILGCPLNPARGEVAFTQPTGAGKAVLEAWGRGGVRIYEEEQDL
ncbi:hypothetical protein C8Q70DRAFT_938209 [Cubamyces menziesii]|uniref:N-acetyltransferase ECO1 n=1 Tax=Trametes cubensis TaxID=1111947 RepID=A0AAD7TU27_9APHY|nr:hypothetical protein C8Q70DRAFT_938209 [Cubamyces menziesii]KAJ8482046.1 hypothetical protein ONZ51_g5604 [Trametes cubensis]